MPYANNEDSGQPPYRHSLISIFGIHSLYGIATVAGQDCVSLTWPYIAEDRFSHYVADIQSFQSMFLGETDKEGTVFEINLGILFVFLHKIICCGYSLESSHRGDSDEYRQHMFLCRIPTVLISIHNIRFYGELLKDIL